MKKIKLFFIIIVLILFNYSTLNAFPWAASIGEATAEADDVFNDVVETTGVKNFTDGMSVKDKDMCANVGHLGYESQKIESVDFSTTITPTKSCNIGVLVDDTVVLKVTEGDKLVGKIEMLGGQALWAEGAFFVDTSFTLKANHTYQLALTYGNICRLENDIDGISVYLIETKPIAEVEVTIKEKITDKVFSGLYVNTFEDEPEYFSCTKNGKDAKEDFSIVKMKVKKEVNVLNQEKIVSKGMVLTMKENVAKSLSPSSQATYSIKVIDKDENLNKREEVFSFTWPQ